MKLTGNAFLYEELPVIHTVFWSKDGRRLDTDGSRGKYSDISTDDPSLTIFNVNKHDAGSYRLTATNAVGSTNSTDIVLGMTYIFLSDTFI